MIFDATKSRYNIADVSVDGVKVMKAHYIDTDLKLVRAYEFPLRVVNNVLVSYDTYGEITINKQNQDYDYFWNLI